MDNQKLLYQIDMESQTEKHFPVFLLSIYLFLLIDLIFYERGRRQTPSAPFVDSLPKHP